MEIQTGASHLERCPYPIFCFDTFIGLQSMAPTTPEDVRRTDRTRMSHRAKLSYMVATQSNHGKLFLPGARCRLLQCCPRRDRRLCHSQSAQFYLHGKPRYILPLSATDYSPDYLAESCLDMRRGVCRAGGASWNRKCSRCQKRCPEGYAGMDDQCRNASPTKGAPQHFAGGPCRRETSET